MSTFQVVVLIVFVVLTVLGVGVFAAFGGLLGGSATGAVVIWGTADGQQVEALLQTLRAQDKSFQSVTYVQQSAGSYDANLVNAIAAGQGPDLFMLNEEELGTFADKISVIPYSAVSQSSYLNSYIDEGQLFLGPQGVAALPFTVDPLVMYYNRDLLSSAGIAQAPQYWNDFLTIAPKITSLDSSQNVRRSAVALGEWSNISNAKAILSALFMQAGDPITARGQDGSIQSVFGQSPAGAAENPASSALRFYTDFANPAKTTYSWNRSLSNSSQAFVGGDVAVYFGFASEYASILSRNPNLHFGVSLLPQLQGASAQLTYGLLTGLAIPRGSHNPQGALAIAQKLTSQTAVAAGVGVFGLPPVRRDVPVNASASAAAAVFSQSALIARGWFDPNAASTDGIFKAMIESVTTGKAEPAAATAEAAQEFHGLFGQ